MRRAYRAAADLLLDAADIVVSTTNSAAIGRMVTERVNFDTVIFEEAAKATGPELVGALSLSGRHLLIGDDRQLPPFDANRMEKIFSTEPVLRTIIESASDVVGGWFRGEEPSICAKRQRTQPSSECSSKSRDAWCNRSVSGRARCSAGKSGLVFGPALRNPHQPASNASRH